MEAVLQRVEVYSYESVLMTVSTAGNKSNHEIDLYDEI
jgi:hypothetical protein